MFSSQRETFVLGVCARENLPSFETLWDDCIQEETRMESKANMQEGNHDHALFGRMKKCRGKGPSNSEVKSEESTSHPAKNLNKIKHFICHKQGHYASQCPYKKKGKGKQ